MMRHRWKLVALAGCAVLALGGAAQATGLTQGGKTGDDSAAAAREQQLVERLEGRSLAELADSGRGRRGRRGPKGARGPQGPAGPKGATGATGPAGPKGAFSAITAVQGPTIFLAPFGAGAVGSSSAVCPPGTTLVSGGWQGGGISATVGWNGPAGANTWSVIMTNDDEVSTTFNATALCATP